MRRPAVSLRQRTYVLVASNPSHPTGRAFLPALDHVAWETCCAMSSRRRRSARPSPQPSLWEDAGAWCLARLDLAGEDVPTGRTSPRTVRSTRAPRWSTWPPTTADETAPGRRPRTPSFVCEVPLRVPSHEERVLLARLQAARALYNACLGEALRRWRLVKESRAYQQARRLPKKTPERRWHFRRHEMPMASRTRPCRRMPRTVATTRTGLKSHLDAPVCQKLASRAYHAVLRVAIGKAKRVRFKGNTPTRYRGGQEQQDGTRLAQ